MQLTISKTGAKLEIDGKTAEIEIKPEEAEEMGITTSVTVTGESFTAIASSLIGAIKMPSESTVSALKSRAKAALVKLTKASLSNTGVIELTRAQKDSGYIPENTSGWEIIKSSGHQRVTDKLMGLPGTKAIISKGPKLLKIRESEKNADVGEVTAVHVNNSELIIGCKSGEIGNVNEEGKFTQIHKGESPVAGIDACGENGETLRAFFSDGSISIKETLQHWKSI